MSINVDQFFKQFREALPQDLETLRQDFDKNAKAALQAVLGKMDLVPKEEFEIQAELLQRTRAKLDALEKRVAELEGN